MNENPQSNASDPASSLLKNLNFRLNSLQALVQGGLLRDGQTESKLPTTPLERRSQIIKNRRSVFRKDISGDHQPSDQPETEDDHKPSQSESTPQADQSSGTINVMVDDPSDQTIDVAEQVAKDHPESTIKVNSDSRITLVGPGGSTKVPIDIQRYKLPEDEQSQSKKSSTRTMNQAAQDVKNLY